MRSVFCLLFATINQSINTRGFFHSLGRSKVNRCFLHPLDKDYQSTKTKLYRVIPGTNDEEEIMVNDKDYVRLTQESAIKITGEILYEKKELKALPKELKRYKKVIQINNDVFQEEMKKLGNIVICKGSGKELYSISGETKEINYAPIEAAKEALSVTETIDNGNNIVINVIGGDGLIMDEVLESIELLGKGLEISRKSGFNSLCDASFPKELASVTVVATKGNAANSTESSNGIVSSIINGEVYYHEGKWWTVVKEDINEID